MGMSQAWHDSGKARCHLEGKPYSAEMLFGDSLGNVPLVQPMVSFALTLLCALPLEVSSLPLGTYAALIAHD